MVVLIVTMISVNMRLRRSLCCAAYEALYFNHMKISNIANFQTKLSCTPGRNCTPKLFAIWFTFHFYSRTLCIIILILMLTNCCMK